MKRKTLIALAVAAALPCTALAQSAATTRARTQSQTAAAERSSAALFERLDKNKDGFISRDEAKDATELQGRFAELDQDNDGKISRAEMRALDDDHGATGTTNSGRKGGSSTGISGSTGGMGGSSGPAGTSSGPNPAGEAPRSGVSK